LNFNQIKLAIYATYITNRFGFRLTNKTLTNEDKKQIRIEYATQMLRKLNIEVVVEQPQNIPDGGTYMLVCNHRSVIDPLIVEIALEKSKIYGVWVAKKELYNSFFFGKFTRNAGTILLDRESKQMSGFFKDVKEAIAQEQSIFIFPEGTRNKGSEPVTEFKSGSQLIALKNRIDILPVYIQSNAQKVLQEAIRESKTKRQITITIGSLIPYKESKNLESNYRKIFEL